jgi:hypothetical protein
MSALLKPPQRERLQPGITPRGRPFRGRGGRGGERGGGHGGERSGEQLSRGRGISRGRGRGRGGNTDGQGLGSRTVGGILVNVGVVARYATGDMDSARFKWPSTMTEREALLLMLSKLSDQSHREIIEITISQVPRAGCVPIGWLNKEPYGHYYFNQHLYGEGGLQQQMNAELRDRDLTYNPDIDVRYEGSLQGFEVQAADAGPVRAQPRSIGMYDPNVF